MKKATEKWLFTYCYFPNERLFLVTYVNGFL